MILKHITVDVLNITRQKESEISKILFGFSVILKPGYPTGIETSTRVFVYYTKITTL